ncbi:alpha-amylase family glycosyl hydrolase [Bacillus sp. UNC438CL73TsuS30]|uniref:alpha-amylase family glycosyl hydrolase n=1 Tax=Bacillus sp. UNC438CL73TsuS30 TaxID=1340434 RepID=UPI00047DBD62|nr:alpha-amylase family glycosyl hydrolase [Bacillus sp. UNC438CL73TsuS30]
MKRIILILISVFLMSSVPANAAVKKDKRLWQDESIYSIMVDRFNDGDTSINYNVNTKDPNVYNGGDFQGIIDKLDYIHDMGFTAIRLNPIFDNADKGYHGFWVKDFYKTDEHFGSIKTFQKLVNEAHKRKMKVLIDFPVNNVAADHMWVTDPNKQDWFHKKQDIQDWNNAQEVENGWADGLPDLNQDNPEVKNYLIKAAKWWIQKTDIDGYSLPEVNMVPVSFWHDFSMSVKGVKQNFFLMGIPAVKSPSNELEYEKAGIDSLFNGPVSADLRDAFATTNQSIQPVFSELDKGNKPFVASANMANYFDNEYTTRFTQDIVKNRQFPGSRWETALTYLYTIPGIPVIYYGTEIALNGGDIPDNRRQMSFRAEKDLIDFITKIGELRNQLPSLTRGNLEVLYEKNGMVIYKREYKGETSVIAINNTRKSQSITLKEKQLDAGKELRGLLNGDTVKSEGDKYTIILDRDKSEIYVLAEKTGINIPFVSAIMIVIILACLFLFLVIKRSRREMN